MITQQTSMANEKGEKEVTKGHCLHCLLLAHLRKMRWFSKIHYDTKFHIEYPHILK